MNSFASAAFSSWNFGPRLIFVLLLLAAVYIRGWLRGRRILRDHRDEQHLLFFLAALFVLFAALASPLDALDNLSLAAHMGQHLLLMMIAPPLVLLSEPLLPILRGLPKVFVKEGLGPFFTWPLLRRCLSRLTAPPMAWLIFAVSTIGWHLPGPYEHALASSAWHAVQHACFFWSGILFWWPIIRPGPGKYKWPLWIGIPYLLSADLVNTALSAFFVFSGRVLYPSYEAIRLSGMTAREDQTLAGAIMWVPGSVVYLLPAVAIAIKLLSPVRPPYAGTPLKRHSSRDNRTTLTRFHAPQLRRAAQAGMLALAILIMADGFFGTQVAPVNLAGVLPWIHWRALSLLALLFVGNLFCMVCPFTFVRDLGRRVIPANRRWPRALRNKWLPVVLFVVYLWAYEAFSLWNSPWLTAALIAAYFVSALAIDGLFRGASFCKYVCPIGQFQFVASLVSPREVRVRKQAVCQSCRTYDCIRGNERARGCELYLFQPKKSGNLDCTFCLDCVKACPHDNVGLVSVAPASTLIADPYRSSIGKLSKRADFAALALIIVFGAFVNAAGMVTPVMMWEHGWHARLGAQSMPLIVGAVVLAGAVLAPLLAFLLCGSLNRLVEVEAASRRFVFALVPVGIAMWVAHLLFHLLSAIPAPLLTWVTPLQLLTLDAGLLLTLYVCWRIGSQMLADARRAFALALPWSVLASMLYAAGVWILFQPMQMRGMMN